MPVRKRPKGQQRPLRVKVERGTPESYLWASFGDHMKAGLASLLPCLVLAMVASAAYMEGEPSISDRLFQAVNGVGDLVTMLGWVLILAGAVYCAAWAGMSKGLVHLFRNRPSFYLHLTAHAVTGAVVVCAMGVGLFALRQRDNLAGAPVWEDQNFSVVVLTSLAIGAAGAAIGAWALKSFLYWYVTRERELLKDVFEFVPGKRAKDEFERL